MCPKVNGPQRTELLRADGITKNYPGVRALDGVSFSLEAGEIHALVGENGAGKSTLINVLSGVIPSGRFEGRILLKETPARFSSPRDAESAGIAVIHQELALVPHISVGENIFLGAEPVRWGLIDWDLIHVGARKALDQLGLDMDPRRELSRLSVGLRQLVEIAKAFHKEARILILDEPTSALSAGERRVLMDLLRDLRSKGTSIIYITHKLEEVFQLADRVTVLRDGRAVATGPLGEWDRDRVVHHMVGRPIGERLSHRGQIPGDRVLEVDTLTLWDPGGSGREILRNLSFHVCAGEVLGIAGLLGAGRSELLNTLFGHPPGPWRGTVRIRGQRTAIRSPLAAVRAGIALVPEDRGTQGLVQISSVMDNLSMAHLDRFCTAGIVDAQREFQQCLSVSQTMQIRGSSVQAPVATLSGGNQQKVVLGKWMMQRPRVLLLDDPTRGIDVGAKEEIYRLIDRLTAEGMALVFVSSELPEVLGLSDRILVLRNGMLTAEFRHGEATQERVMKAATA